MNYNFTGSVTQRRINLGSANEITSSQLTQQAREERAIRLEIRQRNSAASSIQNTYRGRSIAQTERQRVRDQFQDAVARNDFVQATCLTALATNRKAIFERLQRAGKTATLTRAEIRHFEDDDLILRKWASMALQGSANDVRESRSGAWIISELAGTSMHFLPTDRFPTTSSPNMSRLLISTCMVLRILLFHLRYQLASVQRESQVYINLLHLVMNASASSHDYATETAPAASWCEWLVKNGLYLALRSHLMSVSLAKMSSSHLLKRISDLILEPLKHLRSSDQLKRAQLIDIIIQEILTIPDLPSRITRASLTQIVVELPLIEIVERVPLLGDISSLNIHGVDLLANILAIGWKRVSHFTKGAQLNAYLLAMSFLQDNIPSSLLQSSQNLKGKAISRTTLETMYDEVDSVQLPNKKSPLTRATISRLEILPSQDHISSILTVSAKYASSTRESLCIFLTTTLHSWDIETRDQILACITYRHGNVSNSVLSANKGTGVSSHSIEGLVRELWRGWFRGSHLARFLTNDILQGKKALLSVLEDERAKSTWPCLLILCQLYSRSLLTIGDDEFYPSESQFSTSSVPFSQSASRNPLSIDEIIAFSSILRNIAFSLYWYEGSGGALNDMSGNHVIGLKKMDLLSLRDIITRLLQQFHQRDSRRIFAPKDHWLMNKEIEMNSFIESVVLEEQELNRNVDESNGDSVEMDVDADDVDEGGMDYEDEGEQIISRSTISSRIANRRGVRNRVINGALSARSLAYLSPRLGILNNVPFMIPFEVRVEIFHQFTSLDYARLSLHTDLRRPPREVSIRRSHVAEDGFTQLNSLGPNLKHRFAIKFIDQFGMEESGIDGGGLFKEFLTSLVKEAFDTDRGLWSATSDQQLYPNPHSYAKMDDSLQWYRFLGRILGKALYHGILVDVNFASFFLSKWLGKGNSYLDDLSGLESLDKEVYRNLLWLKHYTGDIEKDLSLDFTVTDEEFGVKRIHELIPDGRNVAVTRKNRLEYIYRVSHYRLNEQIRLQSEAFLSGLTDVIDLRWLRMLNREELRILISGSEGEIDLEDLRKHTVLGSYHEKDEVIEYFWKSLESFNQKERKAFLKFVTSCPSPPLLGFGQLNPNFGIRNGGDDTTRLPSSSTCVNLLKLPRYTTYEQCREKLLYAIESGAGFDLS